jgi:hypothetical protein
MPGPNGPIRTAVLQHGCHLQADLNGKTWEEVVWGLKDGTPSLEGRGVMAMRVAYQYGAEFVIFSTGASERNGLKEGEYTRTYAYNHLEDVAAAALMLPTDLLKILQSSELDLESQNTREELERNFRLCTERGIGRVILVSSAWHIERCHAEALKVARTMRLAGETVPAIVAIGDYADTEGLVILEPPHRGDRPKTPWHLLAPRLFKIPPHLIDQAANKIDAVLKGYGA